MIGYYGAVVTYTKQSIRGERRVSENPYQAPSVQAEIVGIRGGGTTEDVRKVATYQKGVLYCILAEIIIIVGRFAVPEPLMPVVMVVYVLIALVAVVFVFLLSMKVYHPVLGVVFAIFTCVPFFGLLVLLLINQRATNTLRQNGIEVGLLGAKTPV